MPDIVLQGWSARGPGGQRLQDDTHGGAFAGLIRGPTENAVPIGDIDPADAGLWSAIGVLLIAYGACWRRASTPARCCW